MSSAQAAKKIANAHLQSQGSGLVAFRASQDKKHGVWVVSYRDPARPEEMLVGGALVVTEQGDVHTIGSTPDAVDVLMESLGRSPVATADEVWAREGESLALPADLDPDEAAGPTSYEDGRGPWPDVLGEECAKPYFRDLMHFVQEQRRTSTVYPSASDLFAAFHLTPYDEVRVVILGQDPYHQPGQAHGLCFSVSRGTKLPPSMRNIHAAMEHEGLTPPSHGDLTGWARQGVLLLNTALTVRRSEANSHAAEWSEFTDAVITKLNHHPRPIVFVLWGRWAQRILKRKLIDETRHHVVTAPHPAARGRSQTAFRTAGTFADVNGSLATAPPIDWSLT